MDRQTDLIARTLWLVETELIEAPDLDRLAKRLKVSPFHLTRAFSLATGQPLMAYVRARRLTEAARALCDPRMRVTDAAFDAGYESVEGFARAFRARFGLSPAAFRDSPNLATIPIQEPLIMSSTTITPVTGRIETFPGQRVVGLSARYTPETRNGIPALWARFGAEHHRLFGPKGCYGVCYDFGGDKMGFSYLCGVPDEGRAETEGLARIDLPAGRYAVFDHAGHISSIGETWDGAFSAWLPQNGLEVAAGRPEFELYDPGFDPAKPGGVAVWLPLAD